MSQSDTPAMQNDIQGMSQSDTPATQNDMTACLETSKKERFCSFPHRHGAATRKPETGDETRGSTKTIISCETSSNFHIWKQPRWTSFASSPIDTAKPPENRDSNETGGGTKTSISCETSAYFHSWKQPRWTGFAASPIDTAKPPENQRLETRQVGSQKEHFVRDFRLFPQLETCEKERLRHFPYRRGEATGKPETRDEARGSTTTFDTL